MVNGNLSDNLNGYIIRFFGFDRRTDHVVPSVARKLQPNQGDPSSQAPQDDVHGHNGGQGRFFSNKLALIAFALAVKANKSIGITVL